MIKKTNRRRIISGFLAIILLITSAGGSVYSWILGDVTPNVRGEFVIGSSSGLVLTLGKNDGIIADLNDYYGLTTEKLELNECTSVDGNIIFTRDYNQYFVDNGGKEIVVLVPAEKVTVYDDNTMDGDYLETSFTLRLSYVGNEEYYIYFLDGFLDGNPYKTCFDKMTGSTISTDGLKALRVGMYVDGLCDGFGVYQEDMYNSNLFNSTTKTPKYAIFANDVEENPVAAKTLAAINLPLGTTKTKYNICQKVGGTMYGEAASVNLLKFDDYAISNSGSNVVLVGAELPTGKDYLFKLSKAYSSVNITIRVWLEGMSQYCTDGKINPEDAVKMNLYFVAYRKTTTE